MTPPPLPDTTPIPGTRLISSREDREDLKQMPTEVVEEEDEEEEEEEERMTSSTNR